MLPTDNDFNINANMGMDKTRKTAEAIKHAKDSRPVIIRTPTVLLKFWERILKEEMPEENIKIFNYRKPEETTADIIIVNIVKAKENEQYFSKVDFKIIVNDDAYNSRFTVIKK
jgi:hypothetical protein